MTCVRKSSSLVVPCFNLRMWLRFMREAVRRVCCLWWRDLWENEMKQKPRDGVILRHLHLLLTGMTYLVCNFRRFCIFKFCILCYVHAPKLFIVFRTCWLIASHTFFGYFGWRFFLRFLEFLLVYCIDVQYQKILGAKQPSMRWINYEKKLREPANESWEALYSNIALHCWLQTVTCVYYSPLVTFLCQKLKVFCSSNQFCQDNS